MYNYSCEYCDGTVREKLVKREAFKVKDEFVILEDVPIGVCDTCGARYYHADLVRRATDVARGAVAHDSEETVPVARYG